MSRNGGLQSGGADAQTLCCLLDLQDQQSQQEVWGLLHQCSQVLPVLKPGTPAKYKALQGLEKSIQKPCPKGAYSLAGGRITPTNGSRLARASQRSDQRLPVSQGTGELGRLEQS